MSPLLRTLAAVLLMLRATSASAQVALEIKDFLVMPMTGSVDSKSNNELLLSRVNTLREEAGGAERPFLSDLQRPLFIPLQETEKIIGFLKFYGNEGKKSRLPEVFP